MAAEPRIAHQFDVGRGTVRNTLNEFQGKAYFDVRLWVEPRDQPGGALIPTRRGLSLPAPGIRAAEIARSSRNRRRRRLAALSSDAWSPSPGGFVLGLRKARRDAGLTQDELAARAGIARETIGRLGRGERRAHGPTVNALAWSRPPTNRSELA
jgi:hypothetical protein